MGIYISCACVDDVYSCVLSYGCTYSLRRVYTCQGCICIFYYPPDEKLFCSHKEEPVCISGFSHCYFPPLSPSSRLIMVALTHCNALKSTTAVKTALPANGVVAFARRRQAISRKWRHANCVPIVSVGRGLLHLVPITIIRRSWCCCRRRRCLLDGAGVDAKVVAIMRRRAGVYNVMFCFFFVSISFSF